MVEEVKGDLIYGEFTLGGEHTMPDKKWCIIEFYIWNLNNFTNQSYPNKFNLKKKKKQKVTDKIIFKYSTLPINETSYHICYD